MDGPNDQKAAARAEQREGGRRVDGMDGAGPLNVNLGQIQSCNILAIILSWCPSSHIADVLDLNQNFWILLGVHHPPDVDRAR